ncbi:MAG: DUF2384 domain-containing protein [Chromatiales bacterium]|nr:DUF2384 domain-containing protein [Chromatiales bacterium]
MAMIFNHDERVAMAQMTMDALDHWKVEPGDQLALLGLTGRMKARALVRFRQGDALPDEEDLLTRASHLIRIGEALHTSFPHNAAMAGYWITTPNRNFNNSTPLQVMLNNGIDGIRQVHGALDCTQMWI